MPIGTNRPAETGRTTNRRWRREDVDPAGRADEGGGAHDALDEARRELQELHLREAAVRTTWSRFRAAVVIVCVVGAPFLTHAVLEPSPINDTGDVLRSVWTYGWRVLMVASFTVILLVPKDGRRISWRRTLVGALVGVSYVTGWADGVADDEFTGHLSGFGIGASVLAAGAMVVAAATTYAIEMSQESRRGRELRDENPEGYAVAHIDEVLTRLEAGIPTRPGPLREALDSLEQVAQAIEIGVCRRARVREPATEQWLRRHTRTRAEAIRDLKGAVCLPRHDTLTLVSTRLTEALKCIAEGRWGDLPEASAPAVPGERLRVRAGRALRDLTVGAMPLAAVAGLDARVGLEGGVATALWTFAVGLAVVTVLSLLDPRLAEKLSLTKALREASR